MGARAVVHLLDGTTYTIRSIEEATPGYVLLEIYPPEGTSEQSRKERSEKWKPENVYFDRVAIPYGCISRVFLTVVGPEEHIEPTPIGFRTSQTASA